MNRDYYTNSNDYINRWVISYADFVTMLLALFMVLYAAHSMGKNEVKNVNDSLKGVFASKPAIEQQLPETQEQIANPEVLEQEEIIKTLKAGAISDNSVKILKEKRGVVIRLNDTMLFDPGSAIIKSEAKAELEKIALSLEAFTNPVVIEGHTDSIPIKNEKYPSNWELSTARATNIISYLTQTKKFPPGRLSAVGYGEYMPVDKNDNPAGRAKNRRVDIVIMSSVK